LILRIAFRRRIQIALPALACALLVPSVTPLRAGILQRSKVQLICHRTANRDMPENTLESLALAARMGCNIVEIDIRRTLDGQLVLNHDGLLERLTPAMGNVEQTSYDELRLLDAGLWMGQRFTHMSIPRFEDALRVAREQNIGLYLDIKTPRIGPQILATLNQEGMLGRVIFGGEWSDIPPLYPKANADPAAWVEPGVTAERVAALQKQGKFVVANFSANAHEMDLDLMRASVAAGVDAINVDYPRLGADAVGRPVEAKLGALAHSASSGTVADREAAIRELSYYIGFPTQGLFAQLLRDPDDRVSHAAAVALVIARPAAPAQVFIDALSAHETTARKNAAWALGMQGSTISGAASTAMLSLLNDSDNEVVKTALWAIGRCPGDVPADRIVPFLSSPVPTIRGAAALALASHHSEVGAKAIPDLLKREEEQIARENADYVRRGSPKLTQDEIAPIEESYREQMKLIQSLESLSSQDALRALASQAFRPVKDYSQVTAVVSSYQLWDRIEEEPGLAIASLNSADINVANRAEWMLVKAGPGVLPALRQSLNSAEPATRRRVIRILAWQGDQQSLPLLRELQVTNPEDKELVDWTIHKIEQLTLNP
jgi:HEAT repeat protein